MRKFLLLLLILAAPVVAIWRGWWDVPPQWNPWAPLDVRLAPNLLTPLKLMRLQQDRELCAQALQSSALRYSAVADGPVSGCPIENAVRVQASELAFSGSFVATCPLAVAYAMFERHGLQPAAQAVFGQPVTRIEHFGSFACRNIAGSTRRSQHASANAFDIAGFRLRDGRRITVARDWKGDDDAARFLRLVHDAACGSFNTTLGPQYNAAHHDHFHVDMGLYRMCR
ncbi:extensin family protein [Pseudomonas kuykendallii]|uniref:Extensin n=1 Tax=Pseudomonas kuykendallii TaxID=1007099 RepID=A0A2W5D1T0_9PSED|nr:extensin family protein [Pseudomonas kuykendallii]PZP22410.1 MAG: extensin [Pseudomonas kuykendallii]